MIFVKTDNMLTDGSYNSLKLQKIVIYLERRTSKEAFIVREICVEISTL